jgi:hypothetical protein
MVDDQATQTGLHALCVEPDPAPLPYVPACYRCQMGDPCFGHETPDEHFGLSDKGRPDDANAAATAAVKPEPISEKPELGPPPASTVEYVRQLLIDYDATRPRSMQTRLGPSEIGTPCRRQIAAKLAGIPQRVESKPPWAPLQGTAVHALMEDVLRFENGRLGRDRWVIESDLTIAQLADGEQLTGHGDAYDADEQLVVDWKHNGTTARRQAVRRTVPNHELISPEYRVQAHLYGRGHVNAGRPVRAVRAVMLARSHDYDDSVEWTEPYRPDVAQWAIDRFEAIRAQVAQLDLAAHPERLDDVKASPSDKTCAWCPFLGGACEGNRDQLVAKTQGRFGSGLI